MLIHLQIRRGREESEGSSKSSRAVCDTQPTIINIILYIIIHLQIRRGREESEGSSKSNRLEAEAVARAVARFLEGGLEARDLGVVTPYAVLYYYYIIIIIIIIIIAIVK